MLKISEGAVVCHLCWTEAQQTLRRQGVSYVPSPNTIVCVWCLRSLTNIRRHPIPDGPERDEIIARIQPREVIVFVVLEYDIIFTVKQFLFKNSAVRTF